MGRRMNTVLHSLHRSGKNSSRIRDFWVGQGVEKEVQRRSGQRAAGGLFVSEAKEVNSVGILVTYK